MADFIGFGGLNVDYSYTVREGFSGGFSPGKEREVRSSPDTLQRQLIHEQLLGSSGGGSAANVMVALARMGAQTGYIGRVGNDSEGKRLVGELSHKGVDITAITKGSNRSGMIFALQTQGVRDRDMRWFPGDNDTISPEDIDYDYVNKARFLHLTSFAGDLPFHAQIQVTQRIDPRIVVSLDPGQVYAEQRGLTGLAPILERSDLIFPSEEEVELLTGLDYRKGAKQLLSFGRPKTVCVTLGKQGCFVVARDGENNYQDFFSPPTVIVSEEQIADTIGAGDVFAAGFLMARTLGKPLEQCAAFANKVAAKSITGKGRMNYPTRADAFELVTLNN
jgi:ribokinase